MIQTMEETDSVVTSIFNGEQADLCVTSLPTHST